MSEKIMLEREALAKQIACDAKGVGIPTGAAKTMADQVAEKVIGWARKRNTITEADLYRQLAKESKKYNSDLAYVYENHDKII
jgi:hypothetical protein